MDERLKQIYAEKMLLFSRQWSREDVHCIQQLAKRGVWTPGWVSEEFSKVERKESRESARVRSVVRAVGVMASFAYLKEAKS